MTNGVVGPSSSSARNPDPLPQEFSRGMIYLETSHTMRFTSFFVASGASCDRYWQLERRRPR